MKIIMQGDQQLTPYTKQQLSFANQYVIYNKVRAFRAMINAQRAKKLLLQGWKLEIVKNTKTVEILRDGKSIEINSEKGIACVARNSTFMIIGEDLDIQGGKVLMPIISDNAKQVREQL